MNRKYPFKAGLFVAGLFAVVAVASCKRETPPAPETMPATEAPATTDTTPTAAAPAASPTHDDSMDTGLDTKAFAGNFSGTLPCADCPGIDTALELHGDGSFVLTEAYQGKTAAPAKVEGTWTAEESGSRIRLDPNSKSEQDRVYAITSHDQLTPLDGNGAPAAGGLDHSLKREAAAN